MSWMRARRGVLCSGWIIREWGRLAESYREDIMVSSIRVRCKTTRRW